MLVSFGHYTCSHNDPGRIELRTLLALYLLSLPLQLLTTGSLLEQGSTALVAITAVHVGVVVALFWSLLANAIVATQVVEDGTLSSLVVRVISVSSHIRHSTFPHLIIIAISHFHRSWPGYWHLYLT